MGFFSRLFKGSDKASDFLSTLTGEEKLKVTYLATSSGALVQEIIEEQKKVNAPDLSSYDENDVNLLRKVNVHDLEVLVECDELMRKAAFFSQMNQIEEGGKLYKKIVDLNPYNDVALMSYGCILATQGKPREGVKWIEKALKVNPSNERAKQNLQNIKSNL